MPKKKKIRVGVIFGGRSGEHEVSFVSAQSVITSLDLHKYIIVPIFVAKNGQWFSSSDAIDKIKSGKLKSIPVANMTADPAQQFMDVAFPLIHGTTGEDGCLQGLLELADIPYVGSGVMASAVGMDKIISKMVFQSANLPVVNYVHFLRRDWRKNQARHLKLIAKDLDYPVFVKPANSGSSVGINKAKNKSQLIKNINTACQYDRKIMVEQGIENYHELEVAVLGNDQPRASMVGEIISCNEFYDYDAKYVAGKTKTVAPAMIPTALDDKIRKMAIQAFKAIDCSGMARVDFLYDKTVRKLYLSEINTLPGFTSISMYPKLWAKSGIAYHKLLDKLIDLALERHQDKKKSSSSFKQKSKWFQK
ncbi:MAG: D-alanine--D-alanine ligase family protein [Patescibacteria group bacterium]